MRQCRPRGQCPPRWRQVSPRIAAPLSLHAFILIEQSPAPVAGRGTHAALCVVLCFEAPFLHVALRVADTALYAWRIPGSQTPLCPRPPTFGALWITPESSVL